MLPECTPERANLTSVDRLVPSFAGASPVDMHGTHTSTRRPHVRMHSKRVNLVQHHRAAPSQARVVSGLPDGRRGR
eukprot:6643405-Prymnesium_polylepis.1